MFNTSIIILKYYWISSENGLEAEADNLIYWCKARQLPDARNGVKNTWMVNVLPNLCFQPLKYAGIITFLNKKNISRNKEINQSLIHIEE